MARIKSKTLPHNLYRQLKDEIKRSERRVVELEATLQRTNVAHTEHCKQLQNELATASESLAAAEVQIEGLLEEHAMRDAIDEGRRKDYHEVQSTARYYAELSDHLETRLHTILVVLGVVAAFTAIISAVHYLPKVL